ncbi:MAG TPA: AMP-binding protein [Gammaproteobacteria bacterium]|nr:AMP-binding protein [Gammaproteobacteria bacterium]
MEKIWLKSYQPGVPTEINPDKYASINEMFEEACKLYTNRPAFANMGTLLTYQEIEEKSRAFAAYLQTTLKLKKGDSVTLMMPNILQYPIALFGVLGAGLTVVNVNPLYTPRELERQLTDSESATIVILSNFASTLQSVLDQTSKKTKIKNIIITEIGDVFSFPKSLLVNWVVKYVKKVIPKWNIKNIILFTTVLKIGAKQTFIKPEVLGKDIAFLQYTGGTTGVAKGAMLTHRNMVANVEQATAWISPLIKPGKEIIITALPLYHIFSLMANCLTFMKMGALNVLVTNPRDMRGFIKILRQYPFTTITGVNTLFNALLNQPTFSSVNFSHLKLSLGGGMSVQHTVAMRWQKVTNVPLIEAYGLTETSPAACINPLNLTEHNGSIGLAIPSTEVSIRDEQGMALSCNSVGELWVKGPQVMQGYWKQPEETKLVLKDGWVRTGDIATIDEQGFVRIVDRKKDMILVSGFNVYPNEVEEVIAMMPEVAEVAVVGVPFEAGEIVKAYIVKKDPVLTIDAVLAHCHRELTGYKIPTEVEFKTELPKSNVGKILRRVLREE